MRLIDADELKKKIMTKDDANCETWEELYDDVLNSIDNAPTVCGNNPKWCESCVSKGKCASTRPQGDLISRSALKKAVEDLVVGGAETLKDYYENGSKSEEYEWIGGIYDVWELIDNAPIVVNEKLTTERPQGEWIINDEVTCKCSLCQYPMTYLLSPQRSGLHFCPYCGAKMERSDE